MKHTKRAAKEVKKPKDSPDSHLKVVALSGITEISKAHEGKNVFLLDSAGFNQYEIERILRIDQSAVSRILTGKAQKKKKGRKANLAAQE